MRWKGQAFNQLEGMRGIKQAQIKKFFAERLDDMGVAMETTGMLGKETFAELEAFRQNKRIQIDEIATAIAPADEEQGAATSEIARNVEQAAASARRPTIRVPLRRRS